MNVRSRVYVTYWKLAAVLACTLAACTFHDNTHRRCAENKDCNTKSGEFCRSGFCVKSGGGSSGKGGGTGGTVGDSSVPDAGKPESDAGKPPEKDSGMPPADAGTPKACKEGDPQRQCYDGDLAQLTYEKTACKGGVQTCEESDDGSWVYGDCIGELLPAAAELCNGMDDDCDGMIDEEIATASCTVDNAQGACNAGMTRCGKDDHTLHCDALAEPADETCNNVDDDCDGHIDEDTDVLCYPSPNGCMLGTDGKYNCTGVCRPGKRVCKNGKLPGVNTCDGAITPAGDDPCTTSGTAADDNCNGMIDENCNCTMGQTQNCYTGTAGTEGVGTCTHGTQTCNSNHLFDPCSDETTPVPETCMNEGADNDCDGVDDNVPMKGGNCTKATNQVICTGTNQCVNGELACVTPEPSTQETCDGRDNNCNGEIDEGFDLMNDPKHCGSCDNVCPNGSQCCGGVCAHTSDDEDHCGNACIRCGSGQTCCSGQCVNTASDPQNCSRCGNVCANTLGLCPCTNSKCGGVCLL